jgi:hypothetical protein
VPETLSLSLLDFFAADLLNGAKVYVLAVIEHGTCRVRILGVAGQLYRRLLGCERRCSGSPRERDRDHNHPPAGAAQRRVRDRSLL